MGLTSAWFREDCGAEVVDLGGDASPGHVRDLALVVSSRLRRTSGHLLVDLEGVAGLDRTGAEVLARGARAAAAGGRRFLVITSDPQVRGLLRAAGLKLGEHLWVDRQKGLDVLGRCAPPTGGGLTPLPDLEILAPDPRAIPGRPAEIPVEEGALALGAEAPAEPGPEGQASPAPGGLVGALRRTVREALGLGVRAALREEVQAG